MDPWPAGVPPPEGLGLFPQKRHLLDPATAVVG